ncbi:MAG: DUF600 family protein [Clostridia bacterium]|nr:DUF600 family protein [Clostridia bacterium]
MGEKPWTNLTISIEKLKYRVEYSYENLNNSEFDNSARHIIWSYKYLDTPYESFNRKERNIIDRYIKSRKGITNVFELPLYTREIKETLGVSKNTEKNLDFVTEEKIEEMEFSNTHIPKSQILNLK